MLEELIEPEGLWLPPGVREQSAGIARLSRSRRVRPPRYPSGGFVPSLFRVPAVATLLAWYDASDTSTIHGSPVDSWDDKSGHGYTLAQTGTARPATGSTVNGLNALDFDGTNDGMFVTAGAAVTPAGGPLSIFVVHVPDTRDGVFRYTVILRDPAAANPFIGELTTSTGGFTNVGLFRDTGAVSLPPFGATSATTIHQSTLQWTGDTSANGLTGARDGNAGSAATAGGLFSANMKSICVGQDLPAAPTSWFDGRICEVIIYSALLTASQVFAVETYLRKKWGTP